MKTKLFLISILFGLFLNKMIAQELRFTRCNSVEYETELRQKNPFRSSTEDFEKWVAPLIKEIKEARASTNDRMTTNSVIRVPVVVHVIHNGDAIGTGENITDAQVLSQITVLNQDFRRIAGTPGFNTNPVGADMEIEFVMALRSPSGGASNGIDRVNTGVTQYANRTAVETMKQSTVWDTSKYLNMWTVRIGGGTANWNGLLGYAQFPSYSSLPGFGYNTPATEALTDGVVMRFTAFGSSAIAPGSYGAPYDKGRTVTHEIGHWAGLRHIWGDGQDDCNATDFCEDTPPAANSNGGCPTIDSCPDGVLDMVENYMDYTNDLCMNIFTQDQKNRMTAVFQVADRRNSLIYSDALVPLGLSLDGGISFVSDGINGCSLGVNPKIRLKNYGITAITSAQISYSLDGINTQTFNFNGNIPAGNDAVINIPQLVFTSASQSFFANLISLNGATTDDFATNNSFQRKITRPVAVAGNNLTLRLQLDFFGSETSWNLKNSAGITLYSGAGYPDTPSPTATTPLPDLIEVPFNLASNDCYTFTALDSFPDGFGDGGYYEVVDQADNIIFRGGSFRDSFSHKFALTTLNAESFEISDLNIYPNPNKGSFSINFNAESENTSILVNDIRGRQIFENKYTNNGAFNQKIDLNSAESGIYLVTITDGAKKITKKIVVE
jgi:hypothetical protein